MIKLIYLIFIFFLYTFNLTAEIIQTTDGRKIQLNEDGTYKFLENMPTIDIIPIGCEESFSYEEDKDDFESVVGHKYWAGFNFSYEIKNNTSHPIVMNQLAVRYSKDYGFFYTELKMMNFNNPINSNNSLVISDISGGHLYYLETKDILNDDDIEKFKIENGCSDENFKDQEMKIVLSKTQFKTHPDAGNINWKDLINVLQYEKFNSLLFSID